MHVDTTYQALLVLAVATSAAFLVFPGRHAAVRGVDSQIAQVADPSSTPSGPEGGLRAEANNSPSQGQVAWAAGRESSPASAASLPRKGIAASTPVLPSGPRQICIADKAANVEACVKRVCKLEIRFKRSSTCVKLERQGQPWWKIFKKD